MSNNNNTATAPKLSTAQARNLARLIEVGGTMVRTHLDNSHTGFHVSALESLVAKGLVHIAHTILVHRDSGNHQYRTTFTIPAVVPATYTATEIGYFLNRDFVTGPMTDEQAMQYRALLDAAHGAKVRETRAAMGV